MQLRYCGRKEDCLRCMGHMLIRATSMPLHTQGTVPRLRSFGPHVRDDDDKEIGSPCYPPLVIPNSHAAGGRERDLTSLCAAHEVDVLLKTLARSGRTVCAVRPHGFAHRVRDVSRQIA